MFTAILLTVSVMVVAVFAMAYLAVRFAQLFFYFSKIVVMAFGALLAFQKVSLVESGSLNWFLWFLIIGAVLIVICGFPRINQAIETVSEMLLVLLIAQLVLQCFDHQIDEHRWWIIPLRLLILLCPIPFYYLRKNFTLTRYKYKGTEHEYHLFRPNVTTHYYEKSTVKKDLTRGLLNYGDVILPFQRVAASLIYGFCYAVAIEQMFFSKQTTAELVITYILWAAFAVAAFFIDKDLLPYLKQTRGTGEEADGEAEEEPPKGGLLLEQIKAKFSS